MHVPHESSHDPHVEALLAEAGWVRALAKRLARDQAAAEDIAQGALALAIEKRPSADRSLRPWLASVVARLARRDSRGEARREVREARREPAPVGSDSLAPDETLERFEIQQELARRVGMLPDPYRGVLIRRYYDGLSVKEISRVTGATPSTVRSQLSRGLERLRSQYSQEPGGRSAMGAFLIASGSGVRHTAAGTLEVLIMQTSTKVALATVAAVAAAVALVVVGNGQSEVQDPVGVKDAIERSAVGSVGGSDYAVERVPTGDGGRVAVTAADLVDPDGEPSVAPQDTGAALAALTVIRARILDGDGRPLQGAVLRSVMTDGRPRGDASFAISGPNGGVVLELDDDSIRFSRGSVHEMAFAAEADGHATEFVTREPRLYGEINLGDVRLGPGAVLVGRSVDESGRPIAGVAVFAGSSVLTKDEETMGLIGPEFQVPRPLAMSAADGTFEVSGISAATEGGLAATTRLYAHSPGRLWAVSPEFAVTPNGRIDVGRMVLEPVPAALRIEGLVLRPDGLPAAGARVDFSSISAQTPGSVETDADGRFFVVPHGDVPMDVMASDPKGVFGMSEALVVRAGAPMELHLSERRVVLVSVVDGEGEPVADAGVYSLIYGEPFLVMRTPRLSPRRLWLETNEVGEVEIPAPGERFSIEARAKGFAKARTEPMETDAAPERLTVELKRLPGLQGRVLAYGEPVEGAEITIGQRDAGYVTINGSFPNRFWSQRGVSATTDAEGRFTALLQRDWEKVALVARVDGWANGEAAVDRQPGMDVTGIVIRMTKGGALAGQVLPPAGMENSALYVAASRGDETPVSVLVDSDGTYRIEELTPGEWYVEGRVREVNANRQFLAKHVEDEELRWNVVVADGETTTWDVDMRHLGDAVLHGRLLIDGVAPPAGWTVVASPPHHASEGIEPPSATLDSDGRFVLTARPGRTELRLVGSLPGGASVEVFRTVRLQGPRFDWEGSLTLAPVNEVVPEGTTSVRIVRGEERKGDREVTLLNASDEGQLQARVPAGSSLLQVPMKDAPYPNAWETLRSVQGG